MARLPVLVEVEERADLSRVEVRGRVAVIVEGAPDAVVDLEAHLLFREVGEEPSEGREDREIPVELEEDGRVRGDLWMVGLALPDAALDDRPVELDRAAVVRRGGDRLVERGAILELALVAAWVGAGGFDVTSTCEFRDEMCQGTGPLFETSTRDELSSQDMSGN